MSTALGYDLQNNAKCLCAHAADEENHGFLVGTSSLTGSNEIKLLRYSEDTEDLRCAALYHHDGEVVSLGSCTTNAAMVSTVSHTVHTGHKGTIFKLPPIPASSAPSQDQKADPVPQELVVVADIPDLANSRLHSLVWSPGGEHGSGTAVLAVHERGLRVYEPAVGSKGGSMQATAQLDFEDSGDVSFLGGAAWDPHHPSEVAVYQDSTVVMYDLRQGDSTRTLRDHTLPTGGVLRGVSYNPNRPWYIATGGDDYRVKCWDVRKPAAPLKLLEGHAHWITALSFNPFHDQLLASGGSDGRCVLWRVSSISSAPLLELDEADALGATLPGIDAGVDAAQGQAGASSAKLAADVAVRVHDDHAESIVSLAWAANSAWLWATLDYSGRVQVHAVPSAEKYRILL